MDDDAADVIIDEDSTADQESYIWKYFVDVNHFSIGGRSGGSKNSQCKFCDRSFTGMSTTRRRGMRCM